MEMIVGCIFLGVVLLAILMLSRNVSINVNINQPEPKFYEMPDSFDEEGNPKTDDVKATIDDAVAEINRIMLGREDESDDA